MTGNQDITQEERILQIQTRLRNRCLIRMAMYVSPEIVTVPQGVTALEGMFRNNAEVRQVILPDTIGVIGRMDFQDCASLEKVTLPDSIRTIDDQAFAGCTALKEINLPAGLSEIGGYAFHNCTALSEIHLPDTVSTLKWGAFEGCSSLRSIRLPSGLEQISPSLFRNCRSLEDVTLPASLSAISGEAFMNCEALTGIRFPDGLRRIGARAFSGCSGLTELRLPPLIFSIRPHTFENCSNLETVYPHKNLNYILSSAFAGCGKLAPFALPARIKTLDYSAFDRIGDFADEAGFIISGDHLLFYVGTETSVAIPDHVRTFQQEAFRYCPGLRHVTLPSKLKFMPYRQNYQLFADEDGFVITGKTLWRYCGSSGQIRVPNHVRIIAPEAFRWNSALKRVILPPNLEKMDGWGTDMRIFADDDGFVILNRKLYRYFGSEQVVTIPEGVETVGHQVFRDAPGTVRAILPSGLKELHVWPDEYRLYADEQGFVIVGNRLLHYCGDAAELEIPDHVEQIDPLAFARSRTLKQVLVPRNMKPFQVQLTDPGIFVWKKE